MPVDDAPAIPWSREKIGQRLYRLCMFEPGGVVPRVQLFSATGDEQAIAFASVIDPWAAREVWDRHRLVAQLPASRNPILELTVRA
jgi:hypothetical protein